MLQQTQVNTVIPYWERWMTELPDVQALASASEDRVLKLWEGLGYYTRARNLQRAARQVVSEHSGRFPAAYEDVLALPGIGRYTAGAICSIAFQDPRPILDGNVIRVLARVFGVEGDPRSKPTNGLLWGLAESLVAAAGPALCSHLNQALMELGALVCTPRQPRCVDCPVRSRCVAWGTRRVESLPTPPRRAAVTARKFFAFVLEDDGRYLVRQRPAGVLNGRLWEFPNMESIGRAPPAESCREMFGRRPRALARVGTVKHSITRYRMTLEAYRAVFAGRPSAGKAAGRWLKLEQLDRLAFTSAHRKLLALVESNRSHVP